MEWTGESMKHGVKREQDNNTATWAEGGMLKRMRVPASPRTEEASLGWIRRFVRLHGRRHPRELGGVETRSMLTHWR